MSADTPTALPGSDFTDTPSMAGFDADARKIIRRALDYGWKARRSRKGHMLLYAPDGLATTSISRDMSAPRVRRNALRPIETWKAQQVELEDLDPAAPATPRTIADTVMDQPAPVVERRRAHLRSVGA